MKRLKYLLIIGIILGSVWALIPSLRYYRMDAAARAELSPEKRNHYLDRVIKLGLDLQGGMHLVLEVDDSKLDENAKKDAVDRAIRIIRNRIDQFGVSEPVIQKQGQKRIIVELPGLQDAQRAKELIGRTAQLEFALVREQSELAKVVQDLDLALKGVKVEGSVIDTTGIVAEDTTAAAADTTLAAGGKEESALDTSVTAPDLAEGTPSPFDTLIPSIPGEKELEVPLGKIDENAPFSSYVLFVSGGALAVDERNYEIVNRLLATEQAKRAIPRGTRLLWETDPRPLEGGGTGRLLYLVDERPAVTGGNLVNATTRPDPDDPSSLNVAFTLDREGALKFSRVTGDNVGRRLAIVLDNNIHSAPVIQGKIPGGEGRITGRFTDEEASDLAIVLRAGALPAPVEIKEERTVGPTLGRDSIEEGVKAAIVGFAVVMLFMIVYYQASGLLAILALMLNLMIVMAVLAELHAALTMPGIAGLILTIGMAVDANVLIFERIREELAKAKTVRAAIDSGYERAFTTILDANITTLITAFVLWQFGTGPIKGFATTLSIGIVASMFTALVCTRVVFDLITSRRQLRKLSI